MHCSVPVQYECSPFYLVRNSHHFDVFNAKMYTIPLCLHLMYTAVQITPTIADITSADTALTVPYTVQSVHNNVHIISNVHIHIEPPIKCSGEYLICASRKNNYFSLIMLEKSCS